MGRIRTVNHDLPKNLGRDSRTSGLRYKRPDNGRYVYLSTVPEDVAIRLAGVLNDAFGLPPPKGMRHLYRQSFMAYGWRDTERRLVEIAATKLPDIMPLQRGIAVQEQVRHSWAYDIPKAGALRHGLRPIKAKESLTWVRGLFLAARKNATARGITFDLTLADVEQLVEASGGRCSVTGVALSHDRGELPPGRKMRRPWAPSIDRMESGSGYSLGNCRIVCCAANYAMSQWGEEVLVEMAKAIARKRMTRIDRVATG